jgi:hypothetical protein
MWSWYIEKNKLQKGYMGDYNFEGRRGWGSVLSPIQTLLKVITTELQVGQRNEQWWTTCVQRRGDSGSQVHEGFKVGDLDNEICRIGELMDGLFWHLLISSNWRF